MAKSSVSERIDLALEALSNPYRRQLLLALLLENPQDDTDRDPLDLLADVDEPAVIETRLHHVHLPKLESMGFIEWDRESGAISKGPEWDQIAPLLELIADHRDELPEGFL